MGVPHPPRAVPRQERDAAGGLELAGRRDPGLTQLRIPLEGLGVLIHPDMYALPWADKAFGPTGRLIEAERQARLEGMVRGYVTVARKLAAD